MNENKEVDHMTKCFIRVGLF